MPSPFVLALFRAFGEAAGGAAHASAAREAERVLAWEPEMACRRRAAWAGRVAVDALNRAPPATDRATLAAFRTIIGILAGAQDAELAPPEPTRLSALTVPGPRTERPKARRSAGRKPPQAKPASRRRPRGWWRRLTAVVRGR